eukprot:TRINITY_DN61541_c0_g1_i1.p1 TRINITY_DN61541_c0_g1~~TRINITY_DN61541_c0_g1_i1.p1  ORF type:complete len:428 (+),score=83.71 TRINITY_DN61541_c0_g1_i1:64-1347(+)
MATRPAFRRVDTSGLQEEYKLPAQRYGFGVSWERGSERHVDIDLQCVIVDSAGIIVDCAYYNNLKAARAVTHSGDETAGKPSGIQEMVWVNLNKLKPEVSVLVFVVAAYSGGYLKDVVNGQLHVFEEREVSEIGIYNMERSAASVDIVAAMVKEQSNGWKMQIIERPAQQGKHFMDILPLIGDVVRTYIPSAPSRQKVAFAMEKGGVMDLPMDMQMITVGLGWDVDEGEADLDVSAVLLDNNSQVVEAVFFGNLESIAHGIRHTGDNLTGEGGGDDEQILVDLNRVGSNIQQVFFVVNIYSKGKTFRCVANPYCRMMDNSAGNELCRYSLKDAGNDNGLIIAKIAREVGGRWGFHALGLPCRGRTYKDSQRQIQQAAGVATRALMARSTTLDFAYPEAGGSRSAPKALPLPGLPERSSGGDVCCTLQ